MMPDAPVAVLGMHRSGTSCLTGLLEEAGLYLGDVSKFNVANRKGNQESVEIMRLHDDLLAFNGGRWDAPPDSPLRWDDALRDRRDAVIVRFRSQPQMWGFKDPRTLLALDFWIEALPDLRFVGTVRHPSAVAHSLRARSLAQNADNPVAAMSLETGVALWMAYNSRLLERRLATAFPLVCFDDPEAEYFARIRKVCAELGLPVVPAAFFSAELRHQDQAGDAPIAQAALDLYDRLRRYGAAT